MARNENINVTDAAVVELTNADATSITIQNNGAYKVAILATSGTAPGVGDPGAIELPPGALLLNENISDLFPGVASADRVFAWALSQSVTLMVSHA